MLDPLCKAQVEEYLASKEEIVAVYLFGSAAAERSHSLSDLDFALLLNESLDEASAFDLRLETMGKLEQIARRPVDVVLLNEATPLLLFQVFRNGRLLLERDRASRCLFQMRALNRYYDFKPYLDYHQARFRERVLREGLGRGYSGHCDALAKARQLSAKLKTTGKNLTVSLNEYLADDNIQAIVERRLQLAIQVCIDVANYLIAHLGLRAPEELENVFAVLGREGLISPELAERMVGMVRFRNILVHDYLDINQKLVYAHLTERLDDFEQFAQEILKQISL